MSNGDFFGPEHLRAIGITLLCTFSGILSAVMAEYLTIGIPAEEGGTIIGVVPALILVFVQFLILRVVYGGDGENAWGGVKDILYVVFMTLGCWFIAWTIILTSFTLF